MQPLARDGLSAERVQQILTAPSIEVDFGADLLDDQDRLVEDISADVGSWTVERSNYADIHGTLSIELYRDLEWGRDRVRPWLSIGDAMGSARFNFGVFTMTSAGPTTPGNPRVREAQGFDKLWLLHRPVGDTWSISAGATLRYAVHTAVLMAGVPESSLNLGGDYQFTQIPRDMVWCLTDSEQATWLRVINDILASGGNRGLWADENGRLRSGPYAPPAERGVEWVFDLQDPHTNIVGSERALSDDVWDEPNWWRFVRRGMTTKPVEGNGIYTVDRSTGQPYVWRAPVQFLDAADQASLVTQGNRIVAEDTQNVRTIELETGPLPFGHFDVVELRDDELGLWRKCQARSWSVSSDGSARVVLEVL